MKLVTLLTAAGPRVAAPREGGYVDLNAADPDVPSSAKALLAAGHDVLQQAEAAASVGEVLPAEGVRLLPAIPDPQKIICVGLNYADHARETGVAPPPEPVIFTKFLTALSAHGQPIVLPHLSAEVDYEGELVIVIGLGGRYIHPATARRHIGAYCCGNDVSARDWQMRKPGGQWLLGKSFDGFAPIGPALTTADELPDVSKLHIQTRVNGRALQDSNTAQLIFPVEQLVAYISNVCTLAPGDLIFTGTPPGVGFARKPPIFLRPGDTVEVEIERLGTLRNPVVAETREGA